jgi:hypothetical protein
MRVALATGPATQVAMTDVTFQVLMSSSVEWATMNTNTVELLTD